MAWAGTLVLDLGESLALVFNWLLVLALILVFAGTGVWAWACIGSSIGAWAGVLFGGWFIDNSLFEDQDNALLRIFILCGALLGGVFSGYLADTGVVWGWGICCGFLTLASFTAIILGCTISEDRLKKKYNSVQVFLIYGVFSSIGLISGGTLGSWLKVAGIIKLP